MKASIKTALALILFLSPGAAWAVCNVTTTPMSFGNYDITLLTPTTSTATVTVSCNDVPPIDVTIQIGPSPNSGGFSPRLIKHSTMSQFIDYNLYTDSAMLNIWGDGTGGTATLTNKVGKNKPWNATVYGKIPAGQDPYMGTYSETLTVTILP